MKRILLAPLLVAATATIAGADCIGYAGPGGPCYTGSGSAPYDKWNRPSPHCQ